MDHRTNRSTFVHQVEGFIDVIQTHGMGHERRQIDLTFHGVIYHARKLGRPLTPPKAEPFHTRQVTSWNGRVETSLPAAVRGFKRRTHDVYIADTLKRVVNTPASQLNENVLDRFVIVFRVNAVCCPE